MAWPPRHPNLAGETSQLTDHLFGLVAPTLGPVGMPTPTAASTSPPPAACPDAGHQFDQSHCDARAEVERTRAEVDRIRAGLAAIVAEDDAREAIVDAQMALFDNPDDLDARGRLRDAIRENIRRNRGGQGRSDGSTAWGGPHGSVDA